MYRIPRVCVLIKLANDSNDMHVISSRKANAMNILVAISIQMTDSSKTDYCYFLSVIAANSLQL